MASRFFVDCRPPPCAAVFLTSTLALWRRAAGEAASCCCGWASSPSRPRRVARASAILVSRGRRRRFATADSSMSLGRAASRLLAARDRVVANRVADATGRTALLTPTGSGHSLRSAIAQRHAPSRPGPARRTTRVRQTNASKSSRSEPSVRLRTHLIRRGSSCGNAASRPMTFDGFFGPRAGLESYHAKNGMRHGEGPAACERGNDAVKAGGHDKTPAMLPAPGPRGPGRAIRPSLWRNSARRPPPPSSLSRRAAPSPACRDEVSDLVKTLGQVVEHWAMDPQRVVMAQTSLTKGFLELWTGSMRRLQGEDAPPAAEPEPSDKRFRDPEWSHQPGLRLHQAGLPDHHPLGRGPRASTPRASTRTPSTRRSSTSASSPARCRPPISSRRTRSSCARR